LSQKRVDEKTNRVPDDLLFNFSSSDDDESPSEDGKRKSSFSFTDSSQKKQKLSSEPTENNSAIKWCIFYTDVEHQIDSVGSA
jgi:hypothetical protein